MTSDPLDPYAATIRAALQRLAPPTAEPETQSTVSIARGLAYPLAVADRHDATADARLLDLPNHPDWPAPRVVDRTGHPRRIYQPLLLVAWSRLAPPDHLPPVASALSARLQSLSLPTGPLPAALGMEIASAAWEALALHAASPANSPQTAAFFARLVASQQPSGAFLHFSPADNLETTGYHELILLHAATSFAVRTQHRDLTWAVLRNATYHLNETQPDHSTTQPWGLPGLLLDPATYPLADALLHAARTQHPAGLDPVSAILLADTLECLNLLRTAR